MVPESTPGEGGLHLHLRHTPGRPPPVVSPIYLIQETPLIIQTAPSPYRLVAPMDLQPDHQLGSLYSWNQVISRYLVGRSV